MGLHWLSFCIGSSDLSDCCGGKETQKMRRKKAKRRKKDEKSGTMEGLEVEELFEEFNIGTS